VRGKLDTTLQGLWLWLLFGFGSLYGRYPWITLPALDGRDSVRLDGMDWTGLDWAGIE
jgi:hypothetical protein